MLVGVLVALAVPGEHYTGTNDVAVESYVLRLHDGQRLCVPDLRVPGGTARVRMEADWVGPPPPAFEASLRAGRSPPAVRRVHPASARGPLDVSFPEVRASGASVPGTYCIRPLGRDVKVGGSKGLRGVHPPPTVNGHPLRSEIAIWFLPPRGEKRSVLGLLPDALRRASLFRPGWVGPWTYVLLLFVLVPLLALASIRLLATRVAGVTGATRGVLAVGAIGFALAATWALLTPAFDAPDEGDHYAYAETLAETGNAPTKTLSSKHAYSSRLTIALDTVRIYAHNQQAEGRPPWLQLEESRWRNASKRAPGATDDGGGYLPGASAHSPLYYSLAAAAYLATPSGSTFSKLTSMRLVSALLGGLAAAFVFLALLELFPGREWMAVAGGLLVAFQPMFAFMSGAVNNDAGVNAGAALLMYLLLRGLRRGLTIPLGLALGATLALTPLMKGTGYALYPAAAIALAGMIWRRHARPDLLRYAGLAGAFAVLVGVWAAVAGQFHRATFTTPGGVAPTATGGVTNTAVKHLGHYLNYLWQVFLPKLPFANDVVAQRWPAFDIYVERGWGAFGWYAMKFPHWVYVVIVLAMLCAGALCAIAVWRYRAAAGRLRWELAVLVVALAGVIAGVHAAYFTTEFRPVVPEQGRYVFTALVPLVAIALGSCFAFRRVRAQAVAAVLVSATMGLSFASYMLGLARFFT